MCDIPRKEILRYLGCNGKEIPKTLEMSINYISNQALAASTPAYTHIISDIITTAYGLKLSGTNILLTGEDIKKHLFGAKKCITLACTLGLSFEAEQRKTQVKSMADSVILDAIGTAYIEEFANRTEEKLLLPFKKEGYFSKFRFSPGYGDLPLNLQKNIVDTLNVSKKIGLNVTDTNILIPQKSITAFIGIFETPQQNPKSKCELCAGKGSCKMKKEGLTCD